MLDMLRMLLSIIDNSNRNKFYNASWKKKRKKKRKYSAVYNEKKKLMHHG